MSDFAEYARKHPDAVARATARLSLLPFTMYTRQGMEVAPFHRVYYRALTMFARGRVRRMMVTMPTQHGKSEGSTRRLPAFILGNDPDTRVCIASYNATLACDFGRDVMRCMASREYAALFPGARLPGVSDKGYRSTAEDFGVVGRSGGLRSVGRGGALTGYRVDVMICDDLYKDYEEANSSIVRESAWNWYTSVVRTRLHNESRELLVFSRWHADDIIGRISDREEVIVPETWADIESAPERAWVHLNFPALKVGPPTELDPREEGEALWPERHSPEKLMELRSLDPVKFECLQQGDPVSVEGLLYTPFKTWASRDEWGTVVRSGNYTDVADGGGDYLVSVCYDIVRGRRPFFNPNTGRMEESLFALVTDVVCTKEGTEVTEEAVPEMLNRNGTQKAWVESNNGGRQFARSLERRTRALIYPFSQTTNKESRIITNAAAVNRSVVMPLGWESRWPQFHGMISGFLRNFRGNAHDDAADALTGLYEKELADLNGRPYRGGGGLRRLN